MGTTRLHIMEQGVRTVKYVINTRRMSLGFIIVFYIKATADIQHANNASSMSLVGTRKREFDGIF